MRPDTAPDPGPDDPVGSGPTVRLASVNAASGIDRRTWTPSVERLAESVAGLDADVVALQEVDHLLQRTGAADQTALVAAACSGVGPPWQHRFAAAVHGTPGDSRTFRPASATLPEEPSYGVALLTRWPVAEWRELRLPAGRGAVPVALPPWSSRRLLWVPDEPRVVLAAVLETPLGPMSVVTTHLSFFPLHAARQLRRVVAWCAALPRPLVLLGDLNLPPAVVAPLTGWRPQVRAATYPAARPRLQLDHVLADGPVRAVSAATPPVGGSDHRGVVAVLAAGG